MPAGATLSAKATIALRLIVSVGLFAVGLWHFQEAGRYIKHAQEYFAREGAVTGRDLVDRDYFRHKLD